MSSPVPSPPTGAAPSSPLRLTAGRWLGIYPSITALLLLLGPYLLGHSPTPLLALLLTALLVPMTHYVVFALVERLTGGWVRFPALPGAAHHRVALLVWAVTYPLITAVLLVVLPVLAGRAPIPLITRAVTLIAVPPSSPS